MRGTIEKTMKTDLRQTWSGLSLCFMWEVRKTEGFKKFSKNLGDQNICSVLYLNGSLGYTAYAEVKTQPKCSYDLCIIILKEKKTVIRH